MSNQAEDLHYQLTSVKKSLQEAIIGQDNAIDQIMGTLERFHADLHDDKRPIGSFLFVGQTGSGKSYTVETLASVVQTPDAFIRIDCSEFSLEHEVIKLFGAPPSYVGYENSSPLSKQIQAIQNPEKGFILLLDEIEKANPKFFDAWLQVLDSGRMTDSKGKQLDFSRALIFMTSNIGAQNYNRDSNIGFRDQIHNKAGLENSVALEIKKIFKPEFINRLTSTIHFNPLTREQQEKICINLFKELNNRLARHMVKLSISPCAQNYIVSQGFSKEYGARELKRTIAKHIEQPLAHKLVCKEIVSDSYIELNYNNLDGLHFTYQGEYPLLQEDMNLYIEK